MAKVKVTMILEDTPVNGLRWYANLTSVSDLMYNVANGVNERNTTPALPHEILGKATVSVAYELIPDYEILMADEKHSGVCNICGPRKSFWFGKCCATHDCFMCLECRNALHGAPSEMKDEKGNPIPPSTYNVRYSDDGEVVARIEIVNPGIMGIDNRFTEIIYSIRDPETHELLYMKFAGGSEVITRAEVREIVEAERDKYTLDTSVAWLNSHYSACNKILEAIDAT